MVVINIFSKRKQDAERTGGEVYSYDNAPQKLRVQIAHIFDEAIGNSEDYDNHYTSEYTKSGYTHIAQVLRKEYGVFSLAPDMHRRHNEREEVLTFLLKCSTDQFIDVVELGGRIITIIGQKWSNRSSISADALAEINIRFRENSFGYQLEDSQIIRVDTEYAHKEITKPAIHILNAKHLKGAREEFLSAHENYRHRKYKDAISDCLKAFESTMKAICTRRKWTVAANATSKGLIEVCFQKELVPSYMQAHFTALRALLEAGVPTTRNRTSGHGQGIEPVCVPDHLAALIIHQTASVLIFLEKSDAELR